MRRAALFSVLCLLGLVGAPACDDGDGPEATLTVANDSDFVIDELRVTEIDNPDFGPNLVGPELLFPGEEILIGVECDFYDILIVDETGLGCELFGVELCFEDEIFIIDNRTLEDCDFPASEARKIPRPAASAPRRREP